MTDREDAMTQLAHTSRTHAEGKVSGGDYPTEGAATPAVRSGSGERESNDEVTVKLESLRGQLQGAQVALEQCIRESRGQASRGRHAERTQLAQVLHDGLQQVLVAARLRLEMAIGGLQPGPERTAMDECRVLLVEAIQVSRTLTLDLSPLHFLDDGFAAAVTWLSDWFTEQHKFRIDVVIDTDAEPNDSELRRLLFQAVRELLFNAVKHSTVDKASLCIHRIGSSLQIVVEDAGVGFDVAAIPRLPGGLGLMNVKRRVEQMGGSMDIVSVRGQGTRITITAPLGKT